MKTTFVFYLVFLWVAIILAKSVDEDKHNSHNRASHNHPEHGRNKPHENHAGKRHGDSHLKHGGAGHSRRHGEYDKGHNKEGRSHHGMDKKHGHHSSTDLSEEGYRVNERLNDVEAPQYHASGRQSYLPFIGGITDLFSNFLNIAQDGFSCLGDIYYNITETIIAEFQKGPLEKHKISFMIDDQVVYQAYIDRGMINCKNKTKPAGIIEQGIDYIFGVSNNNGNKNSTN